MPATFQTDAGGLWAEKPAGARLDFVLQWDALEGDSIAESIWSSTPAGLTLAPIAPADLTTGAFLQGGTAGIWYTITNTVTTAAGRIDQQAFRLLVTDPASLGEGIKSVFPDLAGAVASLRRDRLMMALGTYAPDATMADDFLLERLVAAEKSIERDLRVFLTPREMVPPGTPAAERQALVDAGQQVEDEPGYDYDPSLFRGNTWGWLSLRQSRVISVSRVWFMYPAPANVVYTVPLEWVRLDQKPGNISIVPTPTTATLPLNAWLMSVVGGGRQIPLMLQVRYRAGLENAARDFPDLLSLIKQQAILDVLQACFVPASGSVSADGLSQSISFQAQQYQDAIEAKMKKLRDALHGIRMMIM